MGRVTLVSSLLERDKLTHGLFQKVDKLEEKSTNWGTDWPSASQLNLIKLLDFNIPPPAVPNSQTSWGSPRNNVIVNYTLDIIICNVKLDAEKILYFRLLVQDGNWPETQKNTTTQLRHFLGTHFCGSIKDNVGKVSAAKFHELLSFSWFAWSCFQFQWSCSCNLEYSVVNLWGLSEKAKKEVPEKKCKSW